MNDFTKEEFSLLKNGIGYLSDRLHLHDKYIETCNLLEIKLQSMIENYCEHDNNCEHDWGVGFGSIHSPVSYCKKCLCQKLMVPHDIFNKMMEVNK